MTDTTSRRRPEETPPRQELRGVVERLTYQNPENGYTVARLAPERPQDEARAAQADDRLVTIVGTLADLTPGEAIVAHGWWRNDAKHGWQFQVLDYRTSLPATTQGMRRYLGSGLVKGVGPVMAGRIVDAFGEGTFDVIDASPDLCWPFGISVRVLHRFNVPHGSATLRRRATQRWRAVPACTR